MVTRTNTDTDSGINDLQVGKFAVADGSGADSDSHTARRRGQYAVVNDNIGTFGSFIQAVLRSPDRDGIITAENGTVGNFDIAAAVDIQTVGVVGETVGCDGDTIDGEIFAIVKERGPIAGIVEFNSFDFDILAPDEVKHGTRPPAGQHVARTAAVGGMHDVGIEDTIAVAADDTGTGNGDISTIAGNDQMGTGCPFA